LKRQKKQKKNVALQVAKAGKKAFWGVLGAVGAAVLATTCVVGVTVATGGAAAPILAFVGAHLAVGLGVTAAAGAAGGGCMAVKNWLKPADGEAELAAIEERHAKAYAMWQGAKDLRDKYEKLQINIRATEAHTGTLLSILRMATGSASSTVANIHDVLDIPELFETLGLNKPEFFKSWLQQIEDMNQANHALHKCCLQVVLQFGTNADIHGASSSSP